MPRQKQSKPKALKQQREEVEQLIRDGGSADPKKPDEDLPPRAASESGDSSNFEKGRHGQSRKRRRHKSNMTLKLVKKTQSKCMPKTPKLNKSCDFKEKIPSPNGNNNDIKSDQNKDIVADDASIEAVSDSNVSEVDKFKDKYDMIKERSLQRAIKVQKNTETNAKQSPTKGQHSPVRVLERRLPKSPTEVESLVPKSPPQPKPTVHNLMSQLHKWQDSGEPVHPNRLNNADVLKSRQRSISEGMLSPQEALSKQQALEALLQITGVEFHTMSTKPSSGITLPREITTTTPTTPQTLPTATKGSLVKMGEMDRGLVNYHFQAAKEQGLKLMYTTQSDGQGNEELVNYQSRKTSTKSNLLDATDDPTAKLKCCKKPGRHVCQFCGRRCTKPSVLKKHIRSHTGERPYPCQPCGFSFKTKSNLYKHCKTHAHAIKAEQAPNSVDPSKLPDLDEDDSEETESEDELTECITPSVQTDKLLHCDVHMQRDSAPLSQMEQLRKPLGEDRNTIPAMQARAPRSHGAITQKQQVHNQTYQETMLLRHSSSSNTTPNPVLPTANIKMEMPQLTSLLPTQSTPSEIVHQTLPMPASLAEFSPRVNCNSQRKQPILDAKTDEEVVMSASGASSGQLLKSILPGELAGFRIDMETRRAIPVLNPQSGTQGPSSPASQSNESSLSSLSSSSKAGQLLIPLTGFNIVKSGGQYHVQIPVQGISENSLTMTLDGEPASSNDTSSRTSEIKGVSKESLQERIQLLISQNQAIVDNALLESVKPRRTSTSRRESENNSPRRDYPTEPVSDGTSEEYTLNSLAHFRRDSVPDIQQPPVVSTPLPHYPLPEEGNLWERVFKSQQQHSSLVGVTAAELQLPKGLSNSSKSGAPIKHAFIPVDNGNSIKDLLLKDRPQRLAQIVQHSPVHMPGDSPGSGHGSPTVRLYPGPSWAMPQVGDSAMNQLRGTLQQAKVDPGVHGQMSSSMYHTAEDINVSQRISELRGASRRRKYKSESDVFGDLAPGGPTSPKRRARKIKDIPTAISPLATSNTRQHLPNLPVRQTILELQRGSPSSPPVTQFKSYPSRATSQPCTVSTSPSVRQLASSSVSLANISHVTANSLTHLTSTQSIAMSSHQVSLPNHTTSVPSCMRSMHSHVTTLQSHKMSSPSHVTLIPTHVAAKTCNMTAPSHISPSHISANHMAYMPPYPSPMASIAGLLTSQSNQLTLCTNHSIFEGNPVSCNPTGIYTQPPSTLSEVSVIQHTRMQVKGEPSIKELKLEVPPAKDVPPGYQWQHRFPMPQTSPKMSSQASEGLHLLAVASNKPSSTSSAQISSRKRSLSMTEGMKTTEKYDNRIMSPHAKQDHDVSHEKKKPSHDATNAAPIAMQLLAAVANNSSYVPWHTGSHLTTSSQALPSRSCPTTSQKDITTEHELKTDKRQSNLGSPGPESKRMKTESNTVSPKSPRSEASKPNLTNLPKVPASRRHLTLDLKSPLTSRLKSPIASESKSFLQIDPKSLLTPEALSIAESVMKLASPMKPNTPITPVESARELGRLMAHAFHNAGGKVESLITSTQGTMMIGPIATPTPGSKSGSTQYFIIPSPSSSQPPTGFPGPNTLSSPSETGTPCVTTTAGINTPSTSLVSPLRSPSLKFSFQTEHKVVTTNQSHYKLVMPHKQGIPGKLDKLVFSNVKTNSALKQRIRWPALSCSTARNPKITQTTFCCVKRPQPMYVQQLSNRKISMYSNWRPGGNSTHPLGLSWKAYLGLYDSARNKKSRFYYVTTSISPPQCGIVSDSAGWRPEATRKRLDSQTQEVTQYQYPADVSSNKFNDNRFTGDKSCMEGDALKTKERKAKDPSDHEPSRVQIFVGGYKSNEDYVYVRGRGRGKYVCEECGIRCKKPSMLKKHIRTHTDMRPYQCQICNFAFKTKGNLTKHMKSKAHSKKCTKEGLSPSDESCMEHQFSDADDEDTDSAEGDTSDDEDDEDDDDISETHSEDAGPVCSTVLPRERYSSVPIMPDSQDIRDGQGRSLVWHQYHPGQKKGEAQERLRKDSVGSVSSTEPSKSAAKENTEDKQPVKLSRLEVVGKLSRHLTNRHQQSLEKAQKATLSASGKVEDSREQDSNKPFDVNQLPVFHSNPLLPHAPNLLPTSGRQVNSTPPAPPLLDKYGHIVLTKSNSSASQYRLSTMVQESLSRKSEPAATCHVEPQLSPASLLSWVSSDNRGPLTRKAEFSKSLLHSKLSELSTATPFNATSEMQQHHVLAPSRLSPRSSLSALSHTNTCSTVPVIPVQRASNIGVSREHSDSSHDIAMLPHHPASSSSQVISGSPIATSPSSSVSLHRMQRMTGTAFHFSHQEPTRQGNPTNASRQFTAQSPSSKMKASQRDHFGGATCYSTSAGVDPKGDIPAPIFLKRPSSEEDEHITKKQSTDQRPRVVVSGSIINSRFNQSPDPSWMPGSGSAIKQLLLARPTFASLLPTDSARSPFVSPFLPPSLVSPKQSNNSPISAQTQQQPLVSPMLPSKMMQLPPTILSQVKSPFVQSPSAPPREDEQQDSTVPFVPPFARAKSRWNFHPVNEGLPAGEPLPIEAGEETVSLPAHAGNHKCSSCSQVFMKPSQLRIHMRIHLEESSFTCPECMLSFSTRILLAKHERSEEHLSKVDAVELPMSPNDTDPRPFKCKECQTAFRIPGHLAKHLRSRGHRMTLEREGKLPIQKELIGQEVFDQGGLIIDDSHGASSPGGSSDKTDSASEAGDLDVL